MSITITPYLEIKSSQPLKVGYVSRRHADRNDMTRYYSRSPSLHLTGNWLEAAGFGTDTAVTVSVEQGQLLIRIVAE
ncbi:SymE family type I addiction module toxin [Lonsdalea populi]|uniref:SymE family type I addiction module toxin n=1 Tax=Lonsdalea populi TaxID=1172565 RepID=UPI000A259D9D|nr:SymE family type I addiction module toxin [Lonsdalea populi]OSM93760.1 hypothetical protein AU508_16160 [Lonsdalea populi]RAT65643.1 hypothetical protein AU504_16255 [Lonsdalea populi]RAT67047.1 hypothetical protein AU505_16215 [Lonsdalea populi]RAT70698.1 hypothetical protein AU506_16335 [Lonsdalea populi]